MFDLQAAAASQRETRQTSLRNSLSFWFLAESWMRLSYLHHTDMRVELYSHLIHNNKANCFLSPSKITNYISGSLIFKLIRRWFSLHCTIFCMCIHILLINEGLYIKNQCCAPLDYVMWCPVTHIQMEQTHSNVQIWISNVNYALKKESR